MEDDVSNVFCAADAFMAIFGLRRSNEITNEATEAMEPPASEEQDEGRES